LGAEVSVIDDLSGGSMANLQPLLDAHGERLTVDTSSILDDGALQRATAGARYVFHEAALGSVPRSLEQPDLYHRVNTGGTLAVLQAARQADVQRVVFAASSSAYGDTPTLPKVETMPPAPRSPYAASKVAGEAYLRAWAHGYGLSTASLRYFNIFGPRQSPDNAYAAVIAAFAKALHAGERPTIFGDGEQSRDFTFVANAVHANLLAARSDQPLAGEVFNVAIGRRLTVNQLAHDMARQMGRPDLHPRHEPERGGDVKHSLADLTAIRDSLGYEPIVDFDAGLEQTVRWYQQSLGSDV
jgi:nucleoside-diphosphate-sugar epimerase